MLCVHEAIKGLAELVIIVKPDKILSPSLYIWCGRDQKYITAESFSNTISTKWSLKVVRDARRRWPWPLYWWIIHWSNSGVNLYIGVSTVEPTVNSNHWQSGRSTRQQYWWPLHRRLMCPNDGFDSLNTVGSFVNVVVLVYIHSLVVLHCNWSKDLITDRSLANRRC
jgi:hypothetical protein